ncbi:MAG: hypothetical protein R3E32_28605 [Chitinophagales bacterium]
MKIYIISIAVLIALLATSCGNSHKSHNQEAVQIELNNGQKWNVNSEMTPYILDAEQILMNYNGSNPKGLAEQLNAKNKGLIKSCTMNGKSHEELHKWLHPHMQLIENLDDAENTEEADIIIDELKTSFQNYHKYFQ